MGRVSNSRARFTVPTTADGDAIETALEDCEGVQMATFDEATGLVEVRHGEELISTEAIKSTVRDLGYEVE